MRGLPLAVVLGLWGCGSGPSSRCASVCETEARCVDQSRDRAEPRFDGGECTAACQALERDPEGKKVVDRHATCVARAGLDCAAVLACP